MPDGNQHIRGPLRRAPTIDVHGDSSYSSRSASNLRYRLDSPCGACWIAGSSASGNVCPERMQNTAPDPAIPFHVQAIRRHAASANDNVFSPDCDTQSRQRNELPRTGSLPNHYSQQSGGWGNVRDDRISNDNSLVRKHPPQQCGHTTGPIVLEFGVTSAHRADTAGPSYSFFRSERATSSPSAPSRFTASCIGKSVSQNKSLFFLWASTREMYPTMKADFAVRMFWIRDVSSACSSVNSTVGSSRTIRPHWEKPPDHATVSITPNFTPAFQIRTRDWTPYRGIEHLYCR